MTVYGVDVSILTHLCPADHTRHECDRAQYIAYVIPGGECRSPVTVRCGNATAVIACGRHEPHHRQCQACRNLVVVVTEHYHHAGYEGPAHRIPATVGC
ncbi:hypothetical protein F4553_003956 [Allocatelliglobosispora scoriae]|uniref:Uncharacterized protein n=1 Tax=Allocatelliglobosispora scoriae TaxID=643052 RepID=A0A841BNB3_9ACTN|nr:hypothetical protein [Allocatelliglobosispora scoriae]MBB5870577.1 hypothetical protein [Allocatelliglobosispora scoriae]